MLTLAIQIPVRVPDDRVDEVRKATGIANAQSYMGCWLVTTVQGELYFRITLPVDGEGIPDETFGTVLKVLAGTFDKIGPLLYRVAAEGAAADTLLIPVGPARSGTQRPQ